MSSEKENASKPIEPGVIQRLVEGVKYGLTGKWTSEWFGPGVPLQSVTDDPDVLGRRFDYPVSVNTQIQPRVYERVSFAQLRALAENHDLTRVAIETRKDQVCGTPWEIRLKDKQAKPEENKEKLDRVKKLLMFPDGKTPFETFMRQIVEELLVTDAVCIEPVMQGKELHHLDLIDGTTIKRVINPDGRTPVPPEPAYSQILKGVPVGFFNADELIYAPRNPRVWKLYGMSPVEQIIVTVNIALRRQISTLEFYTEGTIPEAVMQLPKDWTTKQIKEFDDWFTSRLAGNTAMRRRVTFIPGGDGANWHDSKKIDLKDNFDDWLARVICWAFSLSPSILIRDTNQATAQTNQQQADAEGLVPFLNWTASLINMIIVKYMGEVDVEFTWKRDGMIDALKQAQTNEIYVRSAIKSIDEVREELGLSPIGVSNGFVTPAGFVKLKSDEERAKEPPPVLALPAPKVEEKPVEKIEKAEKKNTLDQAGRLRRRGWKETR